MAKKKPDATATTPETPVTETAPAAKPMKKVDAVRQALADGVKSPTEGVAYIKSKFGIEMTPQAFSTSKFQLAQAKGGKKAKVPKAAKPAKSVPTTGHENGNGRAVGSAADLARAVRDLVAAHGVMAVAEMVQVFSE